MLGGRDGQWGAFAWGRGGPSLKEEQGGESLGREPYLHTVLKVEGADQLGRELGL